MTAIAFSRDKITYRSGVQLLSLVGATNRGVLSNTDQIFATVGRFERGAIDRAFLIDESVRARMIGQPQSILASALNEAHVQLYEALDAGAYQAVVSRLVPAAAKLSLMVATVPATADAPVWSVADTLPATALISVKHLECFNDGVKIGIHAVEKTDDNGAAVASSEIKLKLIDVASGNDLFDEFQGSLIVTDKDESGMSYYLPSIVSGLTEFVEVGVAKTSVDPAAPFYGLDSDGVEKWSYATLNYFSEGGTTYANADYDTAIQRLWDTDIGYGYLHVGGSRNTALISKMANFAYKVNKPFPFDVPGDLSVEGVVAFMKSLNLTTHYPVAYWMPVVSDDPINGGKAYIGASGLQIGMRCARNAQTDANNVAPKHYPVAGKAYPIGRTGMRQTVKLTDPQLDALAKVGVNPVCYEVYNDGGLYVFRDSLTVAAALTTGDKKLASTAEMSADVDTAITSFGKECLQKPMSVALRDMKTYIETLFPTLQAAEWFVPSDALKGSAWTATIVPNARYPKEKMDVRYQISYNGVARIITVGQTLSK
ncbi:MULTISPECIES: hypothetical protein [Pseudomonas]|uniref:Tail sheath protein n=1 Tax=Pseudomonas lutea TaxID=243924 RepID=A0A9X8MH08_9PSED|nr:MULTISPECIES: hypothetical protein [Pseudomonas]SER35355.1 hypothetical protein SAMN05216409_1188 [Pseudomonas lutea]